MKRALAGELLEKHQRILLFKHVLNHSDKLVLTTHLCFVVDIDCIDNTLFSDFS